MANYKIEGNKEYSGILGGYILRLRSVYSLFRGPEAMSDGELRRKKISTFSCPEISERANPQ